MIHFAPLLWAHMLRLWRHCALRLWTFIFGRHRVVDRSSITLFYGIFSVALTASQGYRVEMFLTEGCLQNGEFGVLEIIKSPRTPPNTNPLVPNGIASPCA